MNSINELENQNIDIRPLVPADIDVLIQSFPLAQREKLRNQWMTYYKEHEAGYRQACVITRNGLIVGYGSLLAESEYACEQDDIFEISDIWISPSERRQGLATV